VTLLEAVVALVILGLVATGCLELFEGAARNSRQAGQWTTGVEYAEAAMEAEKLAPGLEDENPDLRRAGFTRKIRRSFVAVGMEDVSITVTLPEGQSFELHRLIATR